MNNQETTNEYDFKKIALEQNENWKKRGDFHCDISNSESKFYTLGMFPYPSGSAHMGHVRVYTIVDIKGRYKKLKGRNVLNPLGWDAFGLPAENAAIVNKVAPESWTKLNIEKMKYEQFVNAGWAFDMSKELSTCSPEYYRWTQWIFLQFLKHGMAYRANGMVNWCPVDQTVLANEQVIEGKCWRDGAVVEKREMQQWFFKITSYAERLWNDIAKLTDWAPEAVAVQKNWINQSSGTQADFAVPSLNGKVAVFTTRIDTIYGVTALVVAPEHPLIKQILNTIQNSELSSYVAQSLKRSAVDRMSSKEKTGVPTGVEAIHPLTGNAIPVWVGDYVLGDYGTGAVMCVPGHDQRDFDFARKMNLNILEVIKNQDGTSSITAAAFCDDGVLINSAEFSGKTSADARKQITDKLEGMSLGKRMITYNLRDWSVGRQRYWGCPIPIVYCDTCGAVPVPESELPIILPTDISLQDGKANLTNHPTFPHCKCPTCRKPARRETDTLDTFICSSWYAFRFIDPQNSKEIFDSKKINAWMPIDFYVGGLEHAAQHMIYFRFFTKFFKDIGLINFDEPVKHFFCNGMVRKDGSKMSKSKGNIVVPTEIIDQFGSDALRLYIMSDTPADLDIDWSDEGIAAKLSFLKKCYRAIAAFLTANSEISEKSADFDSFNQATHQNNKADPIKILPEFYGRMLQFEASIEANAFHNSVARLYEMAPLVLKAIAIASEGSASESKPESINDKATAKLIVKHFLVAFSVFAPYFSESLYSLYSKSAGTGIYGESWPAVDSRFITKNMVSVVVQVNGKKRALLEVPKGVSSEEVDRLSQQDEALVKFLEGKVIKKKIYVQDKIFNIVVA